MTSPFGTDFPLLVSFKTPFGVSLGEVHIDAASECPVS
ncbi:hypothetical protein BIWAKO_00588 [Bosea sp. BIWAKO-01]|nr:hypothetical protein BIWAKO_00588 [Bosea sp. BIWAKO-01]